MSWTVLLDRPMCRGRALLLKDEIVSHDVFENSVDIFRIVDHPHDTLH